MRGAVVAQGIPRDKVADVKRLLSEGARTDERNSAEVLERYVELREGLRAQLLARRHQLVMGRRGTGKSTLLYGMRADVADDGVPVATVDMEKFKGRAYPDVLIEILVALLAKLRPAFEWGSPLESLRLKLRYRRMVLHLSKLLDDPQAIEREVKRQRKHSTGAHVRANIALPERFARVSGGGAASAAASTEMTERGAVTVLKIEQLQSLALQLSELLASLVEHSPADRALIFIDDFYYAQLEDQPFVLDYLHQVCKGSGAWLKVGGVAGRLKPYREGSPPTGMEPDQDIERLSVDVSLEEFLMAKSFLEKVIDKLLMPSGISVKDVLTDGARERLVLACGGAVSRDYMTLLSAAIDSAWERMARAGQESEAVRVEAEDIQDAARKRLDKKVEELGRDAGEDADSLRGRWEDIREFSQKQIKAQFVLVEQGLLESTPWGAEIKQLESLRLLHRIRETNPNTATWRGRRTVVYMLDLAAQGEKRLQVAIPQFWKGEREFDKLRKAGWVYTPGWREATTVDDDDGTQGLDNSFTGRTS